jgi:hypothetical protein
MQINFPDNDAVENLLRLAAEDSATPEALILTLVEDEDRRRYIERPAFEAEIRVRCSRELCSETRPRPNTVDAIER